MISLRAVRSSMVLAALALGSGKLACGPDPGASEATSAGGSGADRTEADGLRGRVLAEPIERPEFVLADTRGRSYDFRAETAGRLTLLFFGYTHCPDVCPVHLGNIAAVLDDVGWRVRDRLAVVFVTTDPERDTPERIRTWLDRFDASFVGLRGSRAEVERIQRGLGLPPSVYGAESGGRADGTGDYQVGHAAQVIAFSPDGPARVVYPFGTRQADWVHDLPILAEVGGR